MRMTNAVKRCGFVFLPVLIFLQIFVGMSMGSLQRATWAIKQNHAELAQFKAHTRMMTILLAKEQTNPDDFCWIPVISVKFLAEQMSSWWKLHACSDSVSLSTMETMPYYYVIENLGEDACAVVPILDKQGQQVHVVYDRITVYLPIENSTRGRLLVQMTRTRPAKQYVSCAERTHYVMLGRQTWRVI